MGDVLIDANVIDQIFRGNEAVAVALRRRLKSGGRVWIGRQAYNELVHNGPPQKRAAYEYFLRHTHIHVAPTAKATARFETYADNLTVSKMAIKDHGEDLVRRGDQYAVPKNTVLRQNDNAGYKSDDIKNAAQARSLNAEFWSTDGAVRNNWRGVQQHLKVQVAPESYQVAHSRHGAEWKQEYASTWFKVPVTFGEDGIPSRTGPQGARPGARGASPREVNITAHLGEEWRPIEEYGPKSLAVTAFEGGLLAYCSTDG